MSFGVSYALDVSVLVLLQVVAVGALHTFVLVVFIDSAKLFPSSYAPVLKIGPIKLIHTPKALERSRLDCRVIISVALVYLRKALELVGGQYIHNVCFLTFRTFVFLNRVLLAKINEIGSFLATVGVFLQEIVSVAETAY